MTMQLETPTISRSFSPNPLRWSRATGALVAGIALALMAPLAAVGVFVGINGLVTVGDAEKTAQAIAASPGQWIAGVTALFVVVLLDFAAAAGMIALFRDVNRVLSIAAGVARIAYGIVFAVAIAQLGVAYASLDDPQAALAATEAYQSIWMLSLGLFGISLLLVAYLAIRSGFVPKVFGILIGIAGLGYTADTVGVTFIDGFAPIFGSVLFVGEVTMIFWLLIKGRKLSRI